jgi:hypothetical protein
VRIALAVGAGWAMHLLVERRIMAMRKTGVVMTFARIGRRVKVA